ncbi:MAG: hypothetical protein Q8R13_03605 [bacterium]|nr:hypothetical protein [bacterium]MDZ4296434.1 hypothetical protein [Patescibacteria group bacterium]
MKNLSRNPLFYVNALLALVVAAFVLHANGERWHLPAPIKQALAATVGVVTDGGTSERLTVFAAGTNNKIGDSIIRDNGVNMGVGTAAPNRGSLNMPGSTDKDGTIFAAGHIAAGNAVNAGTTMRAHDMWVDDALPTVKWVSTLFSPRITGSCELYFPPIQSTSLKAVTLCWGAAQRVNDTTLPTCAIGAGKTIFNADDTVARGETTAEGKDLSTFCDAQGLCHIALYACVQ